MLKYFIVTLLFVFSVCAHSRTLDVGSGYPYANPALAARDAQPGDTILIHTGNYNQWYFIADVHGTAEEWITIRGAYGEAPVFSGASESMHLSDCTYMRIEHIVISGQTSNGMNIDDGGTFDTPSHHIILSDVEIRDIAATGNNDLLKLSGLDSFQIINCRFLNGSEGGSGIDMVGCHAGVIENNYFERMGSDAIQAKGGTAFVQILRNTFIDGGERTLNLGGSTGLQFFRPLDAPYEAADMQVYANLFVRSIAAVAYVGSTRVDVANNTIIHPEKWVMRILQETVDTTRFAKCGYNLFRNNLVVTNGLTGLHVNIGPNTAPETFGFQTNLWYDQADPSRSAPSLPTPEIGGIRGLDPMLVNVAALDIRPSPGSIAIGKGIVIPGLDRDMANQQYGNPPSIGAREGAVPSYVIEATSRSTMTIAPNPASDNLSIGSAQGDVTITDILGNAVFTSVEVNCVGNRVGAEGASSISVAHLPAGLYVVRDSCSSLMLIVGR